MYRRRVNRNVDKINEIKPVKEEVKEVKEIKEVRKEIKNEPVIKAIYKPRREVNDYGKVPMLNILRPINYLDENTENYHYVPFDKMIDIVLSKGYLNVNETEYYLPTGNTWGNIGDDNGTFKDTTNYKRETFLCGDVIFTHDDHKSIAFLITTVYENYEEGIIKSQLDYKSPVGGTVENEELNLILQSFNACNGNVYMFTKGTKLSDIQNYVSKDISRNEFRKLLPSNVSAYSGETSEPNYTLNKKGDEEMPKDYPKKEDLPTKEEESEQFNLINGVTVEGWLIYMKSTQESDQEIGNITGDVIKSGPIIITKVEQSLNLSNVFKFPYIKSTETTGKFYYNGNDTKFANEPLNSEHYQSNYGDTMGNKLIQVSESKIYSLNQIIIKLNEQPDPEPDDP